MLVIRKDQIDAMLKGNEEEFVDILVARVKTEDPELEKKHDPEQLRSMARSAVTRSETYGFVHAMDQIEFVVLMFGKGPQFDAEPEIRSILDDSSLPADQKLDRLNSPLVSETVWEKVATERDDTKWLES
ncbi:MAG: hypothetical protein ABJA02_10330 [Acidobacteriota bacterium]